MMKKSKLEIIDVPVIKLTRGKYQTRVKFDQQALEELAESFKEQGIIQPLVVRPLTNENYEIVAGERRWRAAQLAGFDSVPCIVRIYSDEQSAAVTTIENLQRTNLNPIEEAQAYEGMIKDFDYMHDEVAVIVGKSRAYITNMLRLLKLETSVREYIIDGNLQQAHGKVLASLTPQQQRRLAEQCVKNSWSVRKLEQAVKKASTINSELGIQHSDSPDIKRLERIVSEQVGAQVKVDLNDTQSGWFKIKFYDAETLAGLLDKIGVDYEIDKQSAD